MVYLKEVDPRIFIQDDNRALPRTGRSHFVFRTPGLALAVHRPNILYFDRIELFHRIANLLLVGVLMHLERVGIARLLLTRALLGHERADDDVDVVHDGPVRSMPVSARCRPWWSAGFSWSGCPRH